MITISLKAARANADMSTAQWAEAIGVSRATVVNWENGRTQPGAGAMRKISELSGIPMDFIFLPSNPKKWD